MSASEKGKFFNRASIAGVSECWPWQGSKSGMGYGIITMRRNKKKWTLLAHRIAKELALGRTLAKEETLHHTCENRLCVNPRHLVIMSRSEHRKQHMREWGWNVSE
jgi:D-hexose-6-phosphate mutarotase